MGNLKKVVACLNELGFKPDVNKFQDKLVIQKTVCLLELLGMKLDYDFSLYVRGPYSPALTKDLYANKTEVNSCQTNYVPTELEKEQLHSLFEISNNLDPALLEIMATYGFFVKILNKEEKSAIINLKKIKSFYSESRIAVGVSRAKQLLFKPSESELEKMKSEFDEWQDASLVDKVE